MSNCRDDEVLQIRIIKEGNDPFSFDTEMGSDEAI